MEISEVKKRVQQTIDRVNHSSIAAWKVLWLEHRRSPGQELFAQLQLLSQKL